MSASGPLAKGARGCPDPAVPLAALARGPRADGGVLPWLGRRLPGRQIAPSANARAAIRQAVERLGLGFGDRVLVPSWNCGSEIDPLLDAGLVLVPYAQGPRGEVEAAGIAAALTSDIRAVYLTHYLGWMQPEVAAIADLCRERGVPLIEDCALALLSEGPDGPAGSFGDAAVFCLYKFFPLIGGGALALREGLEAPRFERPLPGRFEEKALARIAARGVLGQGGAGRLKARLRRLAGRREAAEAPAPGGLPDMPAHYYFDPGFRDARMARISRRLLAQIDVEASIAARTANHGALTAALAEMAGAEPLFPDLPPGTVPLSLPVLVAPERRDALVATLQADGIAAVPWWSGHHRGLDWDLPAMAGARTLKDGLVALPLHQGLGPGQMVWMAGRLAAALGSAP